MKRAGPHTTLSPSQKTDAPANAEGVRFPMCRPDSKEIGKKKTDENGWISISLPDLKSPAARRIEVEFDDPQYIYKRTFHLPVFTNDFDVKFFPEGGALINIPHQNVAFKAQGADGFSKEIEGFLFNSKGDTLTNFRSEHNGMGIFTMNPVNNETYYVTVRTNDSITKRFDLPAIEPKGISIAMSHYKQEIRYEIQKTEATEWPQKLFLLAHTRGKLAILQPINPKRTFGKMNDSLFTEGITHFMLIDEQGNALSERLIFVPDHKPNQWQITTDQPTYGKREKVSLQIAAKDSEGNPVEGTFSVSITDRKSIQPDSLADNILSNLLLTSDLKGYVEDPAFYFLNQDARTLRSIDYLMMTHGWRRHKMENVLRTPSLNFTNYIEKGQTISGRIMGFFGANVKKGPICVLAPKYNIIATTETDEKGQFIVNTSFRDSTTFLVQARTKKGFAGVDILMDPPQYPVATHKAPYFNGATTFMEDYLMNTRDQYYMEGGMRVYNLKEVTVTAKRERPSSKSIYTGGINTYTVEEDRLQGYGQTAFDAASRLPSVTITNGSEIHIRNNSEPAIIVIDDIVYEDASDILKDIQVSDMSSISLLRGADAVILGPRASGGAVVITLKDPRNLPARPAQGIITYTPLGYSESVEFYHPTYDTPEKKNAQRSDFRSTVYWNPELRLDAEGKATIEYYTPDSTAPEDIIIEGVDKNGKVCRILQTINK